jgi:hypothetical protein
MFFLFPGEPTWWFDAWRWKKLKSETMRASKAVTNAKN